MSLIAFQEKMDNKPMRERDLDTTTKDPKSAQQRNYHRILTENEFHESYSIEQYPQ